MFELKTLFLFLATALAEIVGCYLPYLWLNKMGAPGFLSLLLQALHYLHGFSRFIRRTPVVHTRLTEVFTFS